MYHRNLIGSICVCLFSFLTYSQYSLKDIRVRDPYILADAKSKNYYLYVQTGNRLEDNDTIKGVEAYRSTDLKSWNGPFTVFQSSDDHWGRNMIWAPEVHQYGNKYYMFVTFTSEAVLMPKPENKPEQYKRGSQILVADSPTGPFKPFKNKADTPDEWMSLDGTLWIENDTPYMVFCHEWAQISDGTMELIELKKDLSGTIGNPVTLFKATDANWVRTLSSTGFKYSGFVTDGCFLYKTKDGNLMMIWSSFGEKGYALGQAISLSGSVKGPWKQLDDLLFSENGGHGMIFTTFEGETMLTLHQPNKGKQERAQLFYLEDLGDHLKIQFKE